MEAIIVINESSKRFFSFTKSVIAIFSICWVALAGAAENEEWNVVIAAYNQAILKGDFDTIDAALTTSSQFVEKYPRDGRAMTYHGSLMAMKARESTLPWRKLSLVNQGMDWMDKGVSTVLLDKELAGGRAEIEVRMVRGASSARMPKMFDRGTLAQTDFLAAIGNPLFADVDNISKATAYAWLAVLTNRKGEDSKSADWLSKARSAHASTGNTIFDKYK